MGGDPPEVAERERRGERGILQGSQNNGVSLSRIAWLGTVGACLLGAVLLLLNDYVGYFGVLLAVAAAAAVNLR